MGKGRVGYPQLALNLPDRHPVGVRREQEPDDPQPRLGSQRGKHIGIARYILALHNYFDDTRNIGNVKDFFAAAQSATMSPCSPVDSFWPPRRCSPPAAAPPPTVPTSSGFSATTSGAN